MAGVYARSRFAPKPRAVPAPMPVRPERTVHDGQNLTDVACIRITAHGFASGGQIRHTIEAFNSRHRSILLSPDPTREVAERNCLLAAVFEQFPGIDWDRSHQVLIGPDGSKVWAVPDVGERGSIPEDDETFGALRPPTYITVQAATRRAAA
jgi:hypothetical protein